MSFVNRIVTKENNSSQALWIAIGSFASFAVGIVTSMVLSRYFNKEDYGTYKQVMYVYNTLLIVFTLGLPQAFGYFLPRVTLEQGKDVVKKITSIFYLAGIFFSLFLFACSPLIATLLNNSDLGNAIKLFSPVPLFLLPTLGIDSIYATYKKTYIAAIYSVATRLLTILFVVLPIVIWGGTYTTAIIGFVVASFLNFIIAIFLKDYPFRGLSNESSDITRKSILKFSLPLMYGGIWGLILTSSDQFFISRYFGTRIFAEFSNGSMELPFVGMIISACTTVLYPYFSKMNHEGRDPKEEIYPLWKSVAERTSMIIYPMIAFCWVFSKEIMVVLYGADYEVSSIYFRIKLILNVFTLVAFAPVILSIGKTKYYANVHMYAAIALVLLEFISVKTIASPYMITVISVLCQIGKIFALLAVITKYFGVSLASLFPIKEGLIIFPFSLIILFLIRYFVVTWTAPLISLLIGLVIYIVLYFIYTRIVRLDYIKIIKPFIFSR